MNQPLDAQVVQAPGAVPADVKTVKTFCRICLSLCGLEVQTDGKKVYRILPDKSHPYSWRDFCAKGGSAQNLSEHPRRLLKPMKRVGDRYVESTYEEAIADIAERLSKIRREHGPHAIATYLGNPGAHNQPGTIAQNGFMKGVGSANAFYVGSVDTNNYQLVMREMYGSDMAVLIPDVDHAKCFLFIGMNPAISNMVWLDIVPDGWNRVLTAQAKGADLIIVDPRQTPSTRKANTHVVIKPGQDWGLLLGIIKLVFENGWEHQADCAEARGIEAIREIAAAASLDNLSARCGVAVEQIRDVARRFATAETAVCVARTGVSQNRNGTLGEWMSHVLNLITGRVDRRGGRFYHRGLFKNPLRLLNLMNEALSLQGKRRSRIGGHRAIAGAYPMAIMADEMLTPGRDQVRALIINSGNPVVSGADGERLDQALEGLDLLVAIDFFQRESHRHAHWLIPGSHFLEREEFYALFSGFMDRPHAQIGQKVVELPEGVRSEWEFFLDLSLKMGVSFLGIPGMNAIVRTSRRVAKLTGDPQHAFNVRWVWAFLVKALSPLKWKDLIRNPQGVMYGERRYGHFREDLQTKDKRIQAAPSAFLAALRQRLAERLPERDPQFPFQIVNQRRVSMMNSWLVESVKRTKAHGEYVEIHPEDARALHIADEQPVRLSSRNGSVVAKAKLSEEVARGVVCLEHGWGSRTFDPVHNGPTLVQGVKRNVLVSNEEIDELSGMPNLNGTAVSLAPA